MLITNSIPIIINTLEKCVTIFSEGTLCFNMFSKAWDEKDDMFYFSVLVMTGLVLGILFVRNFS